MVFYFFSNFDRTFCQQWRPRSDAALGCFCNVCLGLMSHKKDTRLIRVNLFFSAEMKFSPPIKNTDSLFENLNVQ